MSAQGKAQVLGILIGILGSIPFYACRQDTPSESSLQSIIGSDNLEKVNEQASNVPLPVRNQLAAIGRTTGLCTAFHLGGGLVMTAAHCLPDTSIQQKSAVRPCPGFMIEWGPDAFKTNHADPQAATGASQCIEVIDYQKSQMKDYAIIRVSPYPETYVEIAPREVNLAGTEIFVVGFPKGLGMSVSQNCQVSAQNNGRIFHNCDTLAGNSGSPIFDRQSGRVIAIHNGNYDAQNNYATNIASTPISQYLIDQPPAHYFVNDDSIIEKSFGPFVNNQLELLVAFPYTSTNTNVTFTLDVDIEAPYDRLVVKDGVGCITQMTGREQRSFESVRTPVIVYFYSDYAGISHEVRIHSINYR